MQLLKKLKKNSTRNANSTRHDTLNPVSQTRTPHNAFDNVWQTLTRYTYTARKHQTIYLFLSIIRSIQFIRSTVDTRPAEEAEFAVAKKEAWSVFNAGRFHASNT